MIYLSYIREEYLNCFNFMIIIVSVIGCYSLFEEVNRLWVFCFCDDFLLFRNLVEKLSKVVEFFYGGFFNYYILFRFLLEVMDFRYLLDFSGKIEVENVVGV